jgi:hypothetical protein
MHRHHIAHRRVYPIQYSVYHLLTCVFRDCNRSNVMMDATPLYPIPYHPREHRRRRDWKGRVSNLTRTQRPVRYYIIDFGLSVRYDPFQGPPRDFPVVGGDKSVPEFRRNPDEPCDPFPVDVYYLGNMMRESFIRVRLTPSRAFVLLLLTSSNRIVHDAISWSLSQQI